MNTKIEELKEKSKNLPESELYKTAEEINEKESSLQASVKEGKLEVKQILRG